MFESLRRASGLRLAALAAILGVSALAAGGRGFASDKGSAVPGRAAICQTCDPEGDPPPTPRPTPTPTPPPPRPSFVTLMNRYTAFDINTDGRAEIDSLRPLFPNPEPYYSTPNGVVMVLVDPRLVTDEPGIPMSRLEMSLWLGILGSDISRDGFFPYFVEARVYAGPVHQDGRTVLALRRFLKEVRTHYPLAGVLLVGSFPDASIVRSVFVKSSVHPDEPLDLDSGGDPVPDYSGHLLSLGPELITPRGEIVLGDLDGNWEALYKEAPFTITGYNALPLQESSEYPENGQVIWTPRYRRTMQTFQDAFYIQDHSVTTSEAGGFLTMTIADVGEPSPEVSAADRQQANRIARPEIHVSRLDPLRVAIMPTAPPDRDGKTPLDASGKPQALRYAAPTRIVWRRDRGLERRLIADYVARSHDFRLGNDNNLPFRTSAIRALNSGLRSPGTFNGQLRGAHASFGTSTATDNATLRDYIEWLQRPAVLRGIAAHSDPVNSQFGPTPHHLELELVTGGLDFATGSHVWRWVGKQVGPDFVLAPSFEGITVDANFHIHRTMWESQAFFSTGQSFVVHEGCEVMRPRNAERVPYNDATYGQTNDSGAVANGESLMFYGNGLGLMARNKVFNDTPTGFYDAVKASGRFGFGWRAYFFTESTNAGLDERAADPIVVNPGHDRRFRTLQRKRSYFWNIIGDFTLKIRY